MSRQIGILNEEQSNYVHTQNVIWTLAWDNKLNGRHICADVAIFLHPHQEVESPAHMPQNCLHLHNLQTFVAR